LYGHFRIGTEHEKFGFELGTLRPMTYEQIAELLNGIAERFDWEKVMEGDKIIGLKQVNCLSFVCLSFLNFVHIVVYCYHMIGNAWELFYRGNSFVILFTQTNPC